jgi:hypothetical protein
MKIVLLFFCLHLAADIQDHYKKIEKKIICSSPRNIDCVYLINLDQRPERWLQSIQQLIPYGIVPQRFAGIYGWTLPPEVLNDIGLKFQHGMWSCGQQVMIFPKEYNGAWDFIYLSGAHYGTACFCGWTVKGTIGCTLSHLSVLKDAWDSGYRTVWILEDDFQIVDNPHKLSDRIEELDQLVGVDGWDVLYTDFDYLMTDGKRDVAEQLPWLWRPDMPHLDLSRFELHIPLNEHFLKIGSRNRAHSILYRRCGIEKIMKFYQTHGNFQPYDQEMAFISDLQMFVLTQSIVTAKEVTSDTRCRHFSE